MSKEIIKSILKTMGMSFVTIISYALFITGILIGNYILVIIGFLLIDLTPSYIKFVWKDCEIRSPFTKNE